VIVLGIDPGTASLGYGLVDRTGSRLRAIDFGVFHTDADQPLPERLLAIHVFLEDLIELHGPALLGVERIFHSRNVQTALAVGHARGVVLLAAAAHGLEVREATPSEVKVGVTGYGSANKEQVGRMVQTILGLTEAPHPDDAADALAIAIWAANRERAGERLNAGILDRAAVAPRRSEETAYERAVREAIAREDRAPERLDGTPGTTGSSRSARPAQPRTRAAAAQPDPAG
jgi:crossover junction endodeoxyribonuclease RuvC